MTNPAPGQVVLFGSGETSPSGRRIFDYVLRKLPSQPRIALLETPAGFELNSSRVIGRVGDFICNRLQNYQPRLSIVPARMRGTPFGPDNPEILQPILEADLIFMGPGSPTYAVRQLKDSLAWQYLVARHYLGATLVLASAATVAFSVCALPVYEIYKVGEDLHWKEGLNFFGLYNLPIVFIPHWNNNDGGEELDTSRCFMGHSRFERLMEMLPADLTILGIDEKTALIIEINEGTCHVIGLGGVTLIQRGGIHPQYFASGESFPVDKYFPFEIPKFGIDIRTDILHQVDVAQAQIEANRQAELNQTRRIIPEEIPSEIQDLVAARQSARVRKDWRLADLLRQQIASLGWQLIDTPEGTRAVKG